MKRIFLVASYVIVFGTALYLGVLIEKSGFSATKPVQAAVQEREWSLPVDTLGVQESTVEQVNPASQADIEELESLPSIFRTQLRAHEIAAASDADRLMGYIEHFLRSDDYFYNTNILLIFLERLIEIDPLVAIGYVERLAIDAGKRQVLLGSILTTWARYDPEAAIDYLSGMIPGLRISVAQRLLRDPVFLESGYQSNLVALLGGQGEALQSSLRLRAIPPAEAFDQALTFSGQQRLSGLMSAVSRWMQADPDAVIARIAELPEGRERHQILRMVISQLSQTDAFQAYDLLQTMIGDKPKLSSQIIAQMMHQDPERGLSYFENYVAEYGYQHSAQSAIQAWASTDLDAAMAYLRRVPERDRLQMEMGLGQAYLQIDPRAAMEWAITEGSAQTMQIMDSMLPHHDAELAEDWMTRLDDDQLASQMLSGLVRYKMNYGDTTTFEWLAEFEDHPGYASALSQYFMQSGMQNPQNVSERLGEYVNNDDFDRAFSQVATGWAMSSPDEAYDWVASLPGGSSKEHAQKAMVFAVARHDVDLTLSLIDEMDSTQAAPLRLQVAGTLISQHPSDREKIIRELDLSREEVDRLFQPRNRSNAISTFGAVPLSE
ncbi:MAG: hypothetical protein HOE54_15035 [Gammaproteobacteria bacterium]|nr:hypothetical protein [Gammaproteobacteria bacterium]